MIQEEPELWKPITGYEGIYSVSSLGRIRSDRHLEGIIQKARLEYYSKDPEQVNVEEMVQFIAQAILDAGYTRPLPAEEKGVTKDDIANIIRIKLVKPSGDGVAKPSQYVEQTAHALERLMNGESTT